MTEIHCAAVNEKSTQPVAVKMENIPYELKNLDSWVLWKLIDGKKIPFNAMTGQSASSTDPTTWTSYEKVAAKYTAAPEWYSGIGFVLSKDNKVVGVDIDKCVDPATGKVEPIAERILERLNPSYVEISPSGTGLRAFGTGPMLAKGVNALYTDEDGVSIKVELYSADRYLTLTGNSIKGNGATELQPLVSFKEFAEWLAPSKASGPGADFSDTPKIPMAERVGELMEKIRTGEVYHDSLRDLAAIHIGSGMHPGAVVETLRALMNSSEGPHDERWETRYAAIPGLVTTAKNKFSPEAVRARREFQREENKRIGSGNVSDFHITALSVEDMVERLILLEDGSRVYYIGQPQHILALSDFRNKMAASYTELATGEFDKAGKEKVKRIPNVELWRIHEERKSVFSTTFKAGAGLLVADPNERKCVNTWAGFKRQSGPVDETLAQPFLEHIAWLFGDRTDDVLDWLAHIEQQPGVLPHTTWLHISSNTGTGRNWISSVLSRVFSGYVAPSLDLVGLLSSGYNDRLSRKVLAIVDEIREGGNDRWKHAEQFKSLVTAEVREINPKYGRKSLEYNNCRFLMFSNHRHAIPLDNTDRRVEVVINDQAPKSPDYYERLYGLLDEPEFIAAVAQYLAQRSLENFNPGRHAKHTEDRTELISSNQSEESLSLDSFLKAYPFKVIPTNWLVQVAGLGANAHKSKSFGFMMNELGWINLGQKYVGTRKQSLYGRISAKHEIPSGTGQCAHLLPKGAGGTQEYVMPDELSSDF